MPRLGCAIITVSRGGTLVAKLKNRVWIFSLQGGKKPHLAMADECGDVCNKTLCGKAYSPDERRSGAKTTDVLDGNECKACRLALVPLPSQAFYFTHPTSDSERKYHMLKRGGGCLCGRPGLTFTTKRRDEVTCRKCLEIISQ